MTLYVEGSGLTVGITTWVLHVLTNDLKANSHGLKSVTSVSSVYCNNFLLSHIVAGMSDPDSC